MSIRIPRGIFSAFAILLLAYTLTVVPRHGASFHDPATFAAAEADRHNMLSSSDMSHDHTHDDGDDQERHAGHKHGHNTTDHAHDKGGMQAAATDAVIRTSSRVRPTAQTEPEAVMPGGHERPPRWTRLG